MKKAIVIAMMSCFLMGSVAYAFTPKSVDSSKASYSEVEKKKKKKPAATQPAS